MSNLIYLTRQQDNAQSKQARLSPAPESETQSNGLMVNDPRKSMLPNSPMAQGDEGPQLGKEVLQHPFYQLTNNYMSKNPNLSNFYSSMMPFASDIAQGAAQDHMTPEMALESMQTASNNIANNVRMKNEDPEGFQEMMSNGGPKTSGNYYGSLGSGDNNFLNNAMRKMGMSDYGQHQEDVEGARSRHEKDRLGRQRDYQMGELNRQAREQTDAQMGENLSELDAENMALANETGNFDYFNQDLEQRIATTGDFQPVGEQFESGEDMVASQGALATDTPTATAEETASALTGNTGSTTQEDIARKNERKAETGVKPAMAGMVTETGQPKRVAGVTSSGQEIPEVVNYQTDYSDDDVEYGQDQYGMDIDAWMDGSGLANAAEEEETGMFQSILNSLGFGSKSSNENTNLANADDEFYTDDSFMKATTAFLLGIASPGANMGVAFQRAMQIYDTEKGIANRTRLSGGMVDQYEPHALQEWIRTGDHNLLKAGRKATPQEQQLADAQFRKELTDAEVATADNLANLALDPNLRFQQAQAGALSDITAANQAALNLDLDRQFKANERYVALQNNAAQLQGTLDKIQNGEPIDQKEIQTFNNNIKSARYNNANLNVNSSMQTSEEMSQRFSQGAANRADAAVQQGQFNDKYMRSHAEAARNEAGEISYSGFNLTGPKGQALMRSAPAGFSRAFQEWAHDALNKPESERTEDEKTLLNEYTNASNWLGAYMSGKGQNYKPDDFVELYGRFFPEVGDGPDDIASKAFARETSERLNGQMAGRLGPNMGNEHLLDIQNDAIVELSKGVTGHGYSGPDGQTYYQMSEPTAKRLGLEPDEQGRYFTSIQQFADKIETRSNIYKDAGLSKKQISDIMSGRVNLTPEQEAHYARTAAEVFKRRQANKQGIDTAQQRAMDLTISSFQ